MTTEEFIGKIEAIITDLNENILKDKEVDGETM